MAYLGDIIRTLKNGMASMNEANILRVMRQKDSSIRDGDERVLVGQEMLGGKEVSVSGKMKILLLKIADGTVEPGYVRKNMDLLRGINGDKQNLSKAVTDNVMAMTSCEDVVSSLLGNKVHGLATEIPSASDEERRTEDGLEHFYERVRDACRKVFKKDGYRVLLDKLDACHYVEKIYDDNNVVIAKVTTHEGAVGVGAFGASWCTCVTGVNSDNMYDHYKDYDMRIVFVDRGDDHNSIWQLSENSDSWCMNADDDPDERKMFASIIKASDGGNTLRDIIDAIDNDILDEWLDEEFGINENGIEAGFKYDRRDVGGCCIVTRKCVVNGRPLLDGMYNICKAGFREISEAEFLLPEWVDFIYSPKYGFVEVDKGFKHNLFDLETKKLVFPEWADSVGYLKDGFARITKKGEQKLFDLKIKEFVHPEWFDHIDLRKDGFAEVKRGWEHNLLDPKAKKLVLPEWVSHIGNSEDGFVIITKEGEENLFNLKMKDFVLPEWVDHVVFKEDGFVDVKKNGKWNLFCLQKNEFVFPEWFNGAHYSGDGIVRIIKDEKQNLFDLKTREFVLPEWLDNVNYLKNGFISVGKREAGGLKCTLLDPKTKKSVLPEWFDYVGSPKDGFVEVGKDGEENLFDLKTNELVIPEWFDGVKRLNGYESVVEVKKDWKYNLFDLKTKRFMLPEWANWIDYSEYGFIDVEKNGEHQKIKVSDLVKTESRKRHCAHSICECCGRRIHRRK